MNAKSLSYWAMLHNSFPKHFLKHVTPLIVLCASATWLQPASAQTTDLPQPAEVAPAPAPMADPAYPVLSIGLPPQARLRIDIDARDKELLGVVKSLLEGFEGSNLSSVLKAPVATDAANAGTPTPGNSSPSRNLDGAAVIQLLSDVDLGSVLKNVTHLRAVAFETPRATLAATRRIPSVLDYYEKAYIGTEGGHRIMRADFDEVQAMVVSFPQGGFAMIFQAPEFGMVLRSDGYPNLKSVGPLVTAMFLRFVPAAR